MFVVVNNFNRWKYRISWVLSVVIILSGLVYSICLYYLMSNMKRQGLNVLDNTAYVITCIFYCIVMFCTVWVLIILLKGSRMCSKLSIAHSVCGNAMWTNGEGSTYVFGEEQYAVYFKPRIEISKNVSKVTLVIGQWSAKILIPVEGVTIKTR